MLDLFDNSLIGLINDIDHHGGGGGSGGSKE